jgi:glycosyltransferase involved in cell wall biosynthesis
MRHKDKLGDLAVVLWNGNLGGAQTVSVSLAESMAQHGAKITIVFIEQPWPLAERLSSGHVDHQSIGFRRGRDVLLHPRRYATEVARWGPSGALVVEVGFMGAALRAGGYGAPIVAVEHGALLGIERFSKLRRLLWRLDRASGAWADDAEVAVSDYMLESLGRHSHAARVERIYNGIDAESYAPSAQAGSARGSAMVVGFAGRLIQGKGADKLIEAVARANQQIPVHLLIAGDGPERSELAGIARTLRIDSKVELCGAVNDMPGFWQECDVAAVPSDTFIESFSMVTLEAMACGKPIVASRRGAIPELVLDGVTGTLVEAGDADAMTRALIDYAQQPELRQAHGAAARTRAIEHFDIADCAHAYLSLFGELAAARPGAR